MLEGIEWQTIAVVGGSDADDVELAQLTAQLRRRLLELVDRNSGMWSTDPVGDVGVLPLDGLGRLVVLADVAQELAAEVGSRREDAACDHVALDLAQPNLDLIQPAGIGRREVEMDVLVEAQEVL